MRQQLINYLRAGYPGLYLVSSEESRIENELQAVATATGHNLAAWSVTAGLTEITAGTSHDCNDPSDMLAKLADLPDNSLVLLRDFHVFMESPDPYLLRSLRDVLRAGKARGLAIAVLGCRQVLPPEVAHDFVVVDCSLPDREQLGTVLDGIADSAAQAKPDGDSRDRLLDAAGGMTTVEAENAFALSIIETGALTPAVVAREKAAAVSKDGILEIISGSAGTLDNIGGLELLKNWLKQRRGAFGARAREYGLPSPKGLLIIGIPGTGKSLTAKATAGVLERPLLKLDAGRLFGGLVGQSEGNLRSAIQTAEAIAPCVLWIDEIEKAFAGSRGSGSTDGGTSSRVFGAFVSWMQERTAPVFVVATANDVTQLPPEFLRKGRWDEQFFVDLPGRVEREAIWQIQIAKYGRDPGKYDLKELAERSNGFTGAEIEQAYIDALYSAFETGGDPGMEHVLREISNTVPLSTLAAGQLTDLRKWATGRTRPASIPERKPQGRRISTES